MAIAVIWSKRDQTQSFFFAFDTPRTKHRMESTRTAHKNLMLSYERILQSTEQIEIKRTAKNNHTTKSLNIHARTYVYTHIHTHKIRGVMCKIKQKIF